MPTGRATRQRRAARPAVAFWLVAGTFATVMAFSTVPAPLYPIYRDVEGFGPFVITIVFATYVLGVLAALLLGGHVSDTRGRRRLTLSATGLAALAAALFVTSSSLPVLLLARVLSGVAVGLITPTATAWLADLHLRERPGADRGRADVVATAANLGGLGLGPLVAGAIALASPTPLRTPFVVLLVLLLVAVAAVSRAPETVTTATPPAAYRPQRPTLPPTGRAPFARAAAAAATGFAVFGLFTSLAPAVFEQARGASSPLLAGTAAALVFGAAALAQVATRGWSARIQLLRGLAATALGTAALTVGVSGSWVAVILAGGVLAGAGAGTVFKGAVSTTLDLAAPARRGATLATLFVTAYLGLTVPILGLGLLVQASGLMTAVSIFAGTLGIGAASLFVTIRGRASASARRPTAP